jgi:hypothetical protein
LVRSGEIVVIETIFPSLEGRGLFSGLRHGKGQGVWARVKFSFIRSGLM